MINDEVELLMMLRNGESVESEEGGTREAERGGGGPARGKGKMSEQLVEVDELNLCVKKIGFNLLPAYAVNITDKKKEQTTAQLSGLKMIPHTKNQKKLREAPAPLPILRRRERQTPRLHLVYEPVQRGPRIT